MSDFISIENNGPLLISSSYFGSKLELSGQFFISVNTGCVRVLWPRSRRIEINEMRASQYVVLTRGVYRGDEGLEILFEDSGPCPYVIHLTSTSADLLPGCPTAESRWQVSVWMWKDFKPVRVLQRGAYWRAVASLPHLLPLD